MKRNRFRLATVLRVRTVQENLALGHLGAAQQQAAEARRGEAARTASYRTMVAAAPTITDASGFLARQSRIQRFGDAVVHAHQQVQQADVAVSERLDEWSVAARRVSGLERLHERHDAAYAAELLHEEVLIADERTGQRHHARLTALAHPPTHPTERS